MSSALATLTNSLAKRFDLGDGTGLTETLKATAFKGQVSDAQMTALLIVANQYGLNPWTKEIYAFPDKNNGIVPVVGVDGWSRIINGNAQFDGMEFIQDDDSCTCKIYRKDRSHAVSVTEYMSECKRPNVGPWQSHPKRMLRHKAMIQCARLAFGFGGIYDQDEAERIVERDITGEVQTIKKPEVKKVMEEAAFKAYADKHKQKIASGEKSAADFIAWIEGKGASLSSAQKAEVESWTKQPQVIEGEIESSFPHLVDDPFIKEMQQEEGATA
jgi:phage recombination protein Bet